MTFLLVSLIVHADIFSESGIYLMFLIALKMPDPTLRQNLILPAKPFQNNEGFVGIFIVYRKFSRNHISIIARTGKEIVFDCVVVEMGDRQSQFSPHFTKPEKEYDCFAAMRMLANSLN